MLRFLALSLAFCLAPISAAIAQSSPQIERPVPFDSNGRITLVTPTLVSRLALSAPAWPVSESFREARLYSTPVGARVLVVQRNDGTVARYLLSESEAQSLTRAFNSAMLARGDNVGATPGNATGSEMSQPAGNAFVRNQTFLGLAAYGPATSAILSNSGAPAAVGGYFLAAGSAFFVAARTVKNRDVTRAQNLLATHGGIRGGAAGAGIAAITNSRGGVGYGVPILLGAVAGTIGGYRYASQQSDGEAASSGLMADLAALTTLGVATAAGAFERDTNNLGFLEPRVQGGGKAAIAGAIGTGLIGYALGPRYARNASYNVTSGDVTVAFTGAAIGALGAAALVADDNNERTAVGVATAGLLAGFALSDRFLVRKADRTGADGTLAQLGAIAGALMGGGVAAMTESEARVALGLVTVGGTLGLVAADKILEPGPDGGPLRGVLTTGMLGGANSRVSVSLAPLATALALNARAPRNQSARARLALGDAPVITSYPLVRIAW
jgi:hypothetical protein